MDRPLINVYDHGRHFRHSSGFTLLEVMVALAILTIALTAVYRLHGQTMMMSGQARFYSLAPMLAQSKLSEVERQDYSSLTASNGNYGNTYPGYQWSVQLADVPAELFTETYYHITQIDIDITYNDQNSYQLRTFRFFTE